MRSQYDEKHGIMIYENGTVFKKKRKLCVSTTTIGGKDFKRVRANGKTLYLHRLMAENFIANPNKLKYVLFKNNDTTDVKLENLYWSGHPSKYRKRTQKNEKYTPGTKKDVQKVIKQEDTTETSAVELPTVAQTWLDFCREHRFSLSQSFLVEAGVPLPGQQDFQEWISTGSKHENEELFAYGWLHGSYTAEEMMESSVSLYIENCKKDNIPFLDAISKEMAGDTIYTWFLSNSDQFVSIWGV